VDVSDWIAFGALAVAAIGPFLSSYRIGAQRDGKIDAAIEQLTSITADHEERLRKGRL
jgi:hypothetical protein